MWHCVTGLSRFDVGIISSSEWGRKYFRNNLVVALIQEEARLLLRLIDQSELSSAARDWCWTNQSSALISQWEVSRLTSSWCRLVRVSSTNSGESRSPLSEATATSVTGTCPTTTLSQPTNYNTLHHSDVAINLGKLFQQLKIFHCWKLFKNKNWKLF